MKLLILTSYNVGDLTSGQGLILTHLVSTLLVTGNIEINIGKFRCFSAVNNDFLLSNKHLSSIKVLFSVNGRPSSKTTMMRSISGIIYDKAEKEFMRKVLQNSADFDLALWFGSAFDPVSSKLPAYCKCPIIFHINDSITLYQQRLKSKLNVFLRVLLAAYHEKKLLSAGYAKIIYVSREDYQIGLSLCQIEHRDCLVFIPNGVDNNLFCPGRLNIKSKRVVLLFAGVMCYQPNIDAAMYLIQKILPEIEEDFELRIAGRDPALEIISAALVDPRVVVTGTVENMAMEYQCADIFIAPMISGAGIQNKILQALACGLPVVTTSICTDAFGEVPSGCLVANDMNSIISCVKLLLLDVHKRREIGQKGVDFIKNNWSWHHRTNVFLELMFEVLGQNK